MKRRQILLLFGGSILPVIASDNQASLRGRLRTGKLPSIGTVQLTGDDPTLGVLADERLQGSDFEALGTQTDRTHFAVDKIHTRSLFVHQSGKRLMVTYWCDVCYIRTYTPGICWCCQKYTDLDLRESIDGE